MGTLAALLDVIGTACMVPGIAADLRNREHLGDLLFGITNVSYIPGDITGANYRWMLPLNAALAVLFLARWWRRRHGRKEALRALGAKSRALLAAMVARLRETLKPKPALRPVPGGAR